MVLLREIFVRTFQERVDVSVFLNKQSKHVACPPAIVYFTNPFASDVVSTPSFLKRSGFLHIEHLMYMLQTKLHM